RAAPARRARTLDRSRARHQLAPRARTGARLTRRPCSTGAFRARLPGVMPARPSRGTAEGRNYEDTKSRRHEADDGSAPPCCLGLLVSWWFRRLRALVSSCLGVFVSLRRRPMRVLFLSLGGRGEACSRTRVFALLPQLRRERIGYRVIVFAGKWPQ